MESSSQDRTLPASERKLQRAVDEGQVTRSQYLGHLAVLGVGSVALALLIPTLVERMRLDLIHQLAFDARLLQKPEHMLDRLRDMSIAAVMACTVFGLIVAVAASLSAVAVGGWVQSVKPLMPDLNRLDPLAGMGRMFTKDKFTEVLKMTVIVTVLGVVTVWYMGSTLPSVVALMRQPSTLAIAFLGEWLRDGMGWLLLVVVVIAVVDVPLQRFLHRSRLRMSHQEFKQEHKESEGNPHVRSRLRSRQRELANSNSISAVPKADFVVMNPTHYAVAVRYDEQTMRAPQAISRGADLLALRIRDLARSHGIPVVEAPMLARALYAHAELGRDIPTGLYTAVAQVLAYVYRLRAALKGEGQMPGEPPVPAVPPELDPASSVVATT